MGANDAIVNCLVQWIATSMGYNLSCWPFKDTQVMNAAKFDAVILHEEIMSEICLSYFW